MARLTRMTIPISMELKSKLARKYGIVIARVVKIKERIDFVNESRTASNFISGRLQIRFNFFLSSLDKFAFTG